MWHIGTSSFDVMKNAPSSASAAEDMKNLMTWAMVNMGPLQCGTGSFSARKTWDPDWLRPLHLLRNPPLVCAASILLLAL